MYLTHLHVENVKLLRDFPVSFLRDGKPRMWTVFVGRNGLCKTTLLQAIALAASGPEKSNQFAGDLPGRLGDLLHQNARPEIDATFLQEGRGVRSVVEVQSSFFSGFSDDKAPGGGLSKPNNVISEVRGRNEAGWLCVGYGTSRNLPVPLSTSVLTRKDPAQDRVRSLFDPTHQIVGTDFVARWEPEIARHFAALVAEALVSSELLPEIKKLELAGRGGVTNPAALVESHRFDQLVGTATMRVPAIALSQGYQSTISWVADLIGQAMVDAGQDRAANVTLDSIAGIALIDELDLHLHPEWQRMLVRTLKRTFKNVQFVATTHSPMVLAGLEADEVFLLEQDSEGSVVSRQSRQQPRLLTGGELYQEYFGLDSLFGNEAGEQLHRYLRLASDAFRTDDQQTELERLRRALKANGVPLAYEPVPRERE